ncbi:MAG: hypothetical protein JXA14_26030 [Anaerolineae bacterium]|nr:hypothetical protein [Anaerolineae bacterium]
MSGIFGLLNINATDRAFRIVQGQQVVYQATQELLARYNANLQAMLAVFVEEETENFKERYKLPGGGYLQRRGGQTQSAAVKAYGQWDVAYPLEDFGAQVAGDDVSLAYMTLQEYDRHLDTVMIQDVNTVRHELMRALLNNTQDTFVDPIHGSLSIEPLANNDAVTYPPVIGSDTEAADNHYLESGYAYTAISDTNNPFSTIRDELVEHFGIKTGGEDVVVFINNQEQPYVEDLTDYDPVPDSWVQPGGQTAIPVNLPANIPGRVLGRTNGCWVIEWRWVPAGYMIGIYMGTAKPLKVRVDPADTGLARGLALVTREANYPLEAAFWRHRFGIGCGNRLNGVVMELSNGGGYSIPSGYD